MNQTPIPTVTYHCGGRITQTAHSMYGDNDLLEAREGPLAERVGLGRLLTLPYLLDEPIALHIPTTDDLRESADRDLAAIILAATGSSLYLGQSRDPHTAESALTELLLPVVLKVSSSLATDDDADVYGTPLAVPNLARVLLRGVELSGPEAAAMLNAFPRWRRRCNGSHGFTRNSVADAAHRAKPKHLARLPTRSVSLEAADFSSWDRLIAGVAGFGQIFHIHVILPTGPQVLTRDQRLVLAAVLDYMDGSLSGPESRPRTAVEKWLVDGTRFALDVITGAFLAPRRVHPAHDRQGAAAYAAQLRHEKPDLSDHRVADRLNEYGFRTKSGVGVWHAGTAKALLTTVGPDGNGAADQR